MNFLLKIFITLINSEAAIRGVLKKKNCSSKFCSIHWRVFLNKVAVLQACNFVKKRLQHRCFPVDIAKFLRTPILKNISERLLFINIYYNKIHDFEKFCKYATSTFIVNNKKTYHETATLSQEVNF